MWIWACGWFDFPMLLQVLLASGCSKFWEIATWSNEWWYPSFDFGNEHSDLGAMLL